ncbi:ArdC-like ssDNA-binding domain-containing protein [Blautia faecis]|uniref:LPD16 domain-containing protein n=1 Tax=Blautia faecis TaxID=871665 RepID=UPI001EDB2158|nr:LPD16 domain-containing protein [Blautia faecis]MCG4751566.1 ArdC-like ssDNA-binding domain-containing protein [Blautia faecis]
MADKNTVYMSEKQKVKEITDKLEAGLKELFESEKYKSYLSTMSKFHNYSFNNTLLIAMQKPEATLVAGYQAWQKNFERHVNKGEKAIRILAPAPYKIKEERDKLDPVTGEMMFDENGMPQKEETEVTIPAFCAVSVFDVSQTDGKPIPELEVNELLSTVEGYEDFVQALMNISPVPIAFEDIPGDSKGYFSTAEKRIAVQENMSESQTLKTMVHEVAHSRLHDKEVNQSMDIPVKDRNTKEVEAESVAFTVCQHFGIDTSDYSFGYIAGWSSGRNMKELKSSLDTIRKTASELITGIEGAMQELQLNREMEQEHGKESILLIHNEDFSEYNLVEEMQDTSGHNVQKTEPEIDGDEIIDLGDETEQVLAEMKKTLESEQETELAFSIADRFISIQEVDGGYDYSIMGADYKEIDGGIYDNPDVTIREALHDILEDLKSQPDYNGAKGNIQREDELIPMDYDGLMEKAEEANRIIPESTPSSVVADFKAKTGELFHDISEMNPEEIEETVKCHVQAKIEEYDINATIVDVAVTGSRCRGLEHEGSDLDVVVELSTAEREDDLFNAFNEDGLHIGEVKVDINPITAQRTGTLESYLPQMEEYLEGVRQVREQEKESAEVTLTVSECGEFHNLGECYENIPTVDEAIAIWKQIPSERMNGIPAIGINILGRGAEPFEDYEIDVLSGKRIDLGVLDYVPDIKNNPQAMEVITELVAKLPDMEIDGVMSEEMEARVWELRMPDLPQEEQLAVELDRLSYDYDTVLYHDSTRNMTENVSELAESIKQGDTGHLTTWLADIISEGAVPEEIKRATELLEKLTEYKPLAKIEEAEEQNYNMIDNVLNNGVGEKAQREENKRMEEKPTVRLSLKSRLAEKKSQVEGQSKEHDVQENEKKSQREM